MIRYITVHSAKAAETVEFYQWLLDLPVASKISIPAGEIFFLGKEETKLEIIPDPKAERIGSKSICIGFGVDSIDEKIAMLEGRNIPCGPVISPSPGVQFFFFTDLNGCEIQLSEQK